MTFHFEWHSNLSDIPFWLTFHFEWHVILSDIPFLVIFHWRWHSILSDITFLMTIHFEWHSQSQPSYWGSPKNNCTINELKMFFFVHDSFTNLYERFFVLSWTLCMAWHGDQWISGFVWHQNIIVTKYHPRAMSFIFTMHNLISLNSHCLIGPDDNRPSTD